MSVCRALQCKITSFIFYIVQAASLNIPVSTLMPRPLLALPAIKLPLFFGEKKKRFKVRLKIYLSDWIRCSTRIFAGFYCVKMHLRHCSAGIIKNKCYRLSSCST